MLIALFRFFLDKKPDDLVLAFNNDLAKADNVAFRIENHLVADPRLQKALFLLAEAKIDSSADRLF